MCAPLQFLRNSEGESLHTNKSLLSLLNHYLAPYNLVYIHQFALSWETLVKANFDPSICQLYQTPNQ